MKNEKRDHGLGAHVGPWLGIAGCIAIGIYLGGGSISPIGVVIIGGIAAIGLLLLAVGGRMGEALDRITRSRGDDH